MPFRLIFSLLTVVFTLILNQTSVCQGIKGQNTRRHTIRLTRPAQPDVKTRPEDSALIQKKQILFIGHHPEQILDPELKAAISFCETLPGYQVTYIPFSGIIRNTTSLDQYSLIWFHRTDTTAFSAEEVDPEVIRRLNAYLENGGKMLLTLDAFRYINPLGLETVIPAVKSKPCIDNGYGRNLGFHAFRDHALFSGLNGGAYILKPRKDMTVRIIGFFGDTIPASGKVIGIDWDYIFFREQSKLLLEYSARKGRVIAAGGYTLFDSPNNNRLHLEKFTANILAYLTGDAEGYTNYYWNYTTPEVNICDPDTFPYAGRELPPPSEFWAVPEIWPSFSPREATQAYCEAAGERILIMGSEQGGIEEIWVHPFMAIRDLTAGIISGSNSSVNQQNDPDSLLPDSVIWLTSLVPEIIIRPDGFIRDYYVDGGLLREWVVADPLLPAGVVHYEWEGKSPIDLIFRASSNLRFMWPYSSESISTICYKWDPHLLSFTVQDRSGNLVITAGSNRPPVRHS